jgi:hypothetical protein
VNCSKRFVLEAPDGLQSETYGGHLTSTLENDLMSVLTNVVSEGISHDFDQFSKNMGAFFALGKGGGVTSLVSPLINAPTLSEL